MTTIAYKAGVIAYDSRITCGTTIDYDDYEKCIEHKGVKFVLSGATSDFPRLIEAYFGADHKSVDANALAFDGETLWNVGHNDSDGLWKTAIAPERIYAIGSGTSHALTAMDMGASAAEAIEMAKKRDTCTGGDVRTIVVGTQP
jgi:ATP-dependent protease HslVU (ClpYQ) peptidase subunit